MLNFEEAQVVAKPVKRDHGYKRDQRRIHIQRKLKIRQMNHDCFGIIGKLDKGKVHCSCALCSFHEYTIQDRKRANCMAEELEEAAYSMEHSNRFKKMRNNALRIHGAGPRHTEKTKSTANVRIFEQLMKGASA